MGTGWIEIFNEDDRLDVAKILIRNGYTVCQAKRKVDGKRSYIYMLEYTKTGIKLIEEKQPK